MVYNFGQLFEVIDGDRGKNYPSSDEFFDEGYCLFLNAGNVTRIGWSFETNAFITEEKDEQLRKGRVQRGDTVFTTRGTVGNAAFYDNRVPYDHLRINSGMVILRPKDETIISSEFIYYLVTSPVVHEMIELFCSGSAQPQLPIKDFVKIKIDLPSITNQRKIAGILSAYNNLIMTNNKRIKLLEQMAESLYKEWFVRFRFPGYEDADFEDGVPCGWTYIPTEELSSVLQRGISPVYNDDGEYTVINQKCIRTAIMDIEESRRQSKPYKKEINLQDCDTVICSTGTGTLGRVGKVYGNYENTTFDSHVTLVRANNAVGKHYLYFALKQLQPWFMSMGIGSTNQQELYRSTIKNAKILVSNNQPLNTEFEVQAEAIHKQMIILINTNKNLIKQRDLLFPRLMSGKLEV